MTITDINGCEYVDSVLVRLLEDPLSSFVAVSIITPNNDGDNDFLEFIGLEAFPKNTLRIYNRWGNVVFESFNYQAEGELFDGTRNGERLPPDTYYYVLTFEDKIFKSALTIMWD
ncbi:MAG: gliding motility-associated C-terminal domain-containing protein [Saprospiraceae bacterium]|nr:gliding motility-associated C-terminal domain-containing protein [Saprospiraceae bacterium]